MYIGNSMSVRAGEAYDRGLKPTSRWSKKDIVEAVTSQINDTEFIAAIEKFPVEVLREGLLVDVEWHHTGSRYNETWFMKVIEIREEKFSELLNKLTDIHQKIKEERKTLKAVKAQKVSVVEVEKGSAEVVSWSRYNASGIIGSTVTNIAKDYEATHPGYKVIAGINADYFNMSNFAPINAIVQDGDVILFKFNV